MDFPALWKNGKAPETGAFKTLQRLTFLSPRFLQFIDALVAQKSHKGQENYSSGYF